MTAGAAPPDRYKAVWLVFFTLGLGTLLPWNFFMTATMYFTSRLNEPEEEVRLAIDGLNITQRFQSDLQAKFNNVMTICAMLPLLIFTCLNSFLHQRIPQKFRIMGTLAAILALFMLTALFVKLTFDPLTFFALTMLKIVLINSFGAILQGSLFGLAGRLPVSYTTPIMSGQGLAGTFAAFSLICALSSGSSLSDSAFGYFIVACIVIILAIVSYIILPKLDFFQYYYSKEPKELDEKKAAYEPDSTMEMMKPEEQNGGKKADAKLNEEAPEEPTPQHPSVIVIFKKIWIMALCVCLVFTITIGIFPSVTADAKSYVAGTSSWNMYFIPVSCFLMFNIFDWGGRSLTAITMWPGQDSWLLPFMVVLRAAFIPLFMLCNVHPRVYLPVVFLHDSWYIIFMIIFAFSNGYLASLCMCFGPKKVLAHEAETAGTIMAFFLSLGLALGAAFSFLFRMLV
ncbi:equilibrative nucleoside transporter 1 [Ambystoma mexicanum]|uniref:equilibrative nucleoside transporter 1 n=1 Tax=Ambystoma mexicanum TaxID=8296 RepID=UPI0037E73D03